MDNQAIYQIFTQEENNTYEHYAALDLGSNSFHLVIAREVEGSLQVVNKVKHKVRLAEGLSQTNVLSEEYIQRGVATLQEMTPILQGLPHRKVRVVATYTLRRARNAKTFLSEAKKVFPYPIEIIAGAEEARLIYVGIHSGLNLKLSKLIFDIGGGSTEFAIGIDASPTMCKSINMGCVSYQKRFFNDGKISYKSCDAAITEARRQMELATRKLKEFQWQAVYASSGTAKAIASVLHPSDSGEPNTPVTRQELQLLMAQCIEKGNESALDFAGLTDDRKPVFAAGVCIMLGIFQSLDIDVMEYSPNALREGVLAELQPTRANQNVCLNTAQSMVKRYHVDTQYAHHHLQCCMQLYNQVKHEWDIRDAQLRFVLGWASLLHEVGLHINAKGIQKHSAYILQHADMPGFNQDQQLIIATLVRFHRKKIRTEEFPEIVNFSPSHIHRLLAIMRLSSVLNMNRRKPVQILSVRASSANSIDLTFDSNTASAHGLLEADLQSECDYLKAIDIQVSYRIATSS